MKYDMHNTKYTILKQKDLEGEEESPQSEVNDQEGSSSLCLIFVCQCSALAVPTFLRQANILLGPPN